MPLQFFENQNWLALPGADVNVSYTITAYVDPAIGGPTPKYFAKKAGGLPLSNPVGPGSPGCSPGYYDTLQDAETACQTDYGL